MQRIIRLGMMASLAFVGTAGVTLGHSPIPNGSNNTPLPECGPTLEITMQPVANNLHQVFIKFEWTDNTGIEEIEIKMLKKDSDGNYTIEVGDKTITTIVPTSSTEAQMFPANAQPANTKVRIKITTKAMDGTVIKTVTSNQVTLP